VLVNNAGNDQRHRSHEVSPEYWRRTLALNLDHQFFACQAVRPQMQAAGGGAIINLSSIAWMGGGAANLVAYSAAKAAIVGMTNSLAREFGEDRIRVNAIAPGAVITPRQVELWYSDADVDAIVARQCLKERLLAEDVARMALFLAADDSRMITKQCFVVDAGLR
jgi:NAD(P)-dependent dehydrogenase (short-subunit alcohol dehydrogenase family)